MGKETHAATNARSCAAVCSWPAPDSRIALNGILRGQSTSRLWYFASLIIKVCPQLNCGRKISPWWLWGHVANTVQKQNTETSTTSALTLQSNRFDCSFGAPFLQPIPRDGDRACPKSVTHCLIRNRSSQSFARAAPLPSYPFIHKGVAWSHPNRRTFGWKVSGNGLDQHLLGKTGTSVLVWCWW